MTEKELGKALLELDVTAAPAPPDPRQLTRTILQRDRRRVRWLTVLSVFFWVLSAAGVVVIIWFYFFHINPRLAAYGAGRAHLQNDWNDWVYAADMGARFVLGCIATFLLAAVCTVLLILASRRAVLRQINANLAEISEQLKRLRAVPPGTE
jgi:hypothetical protein